MRAAYIHGIRDVRMGELPEPEAGGQELKLKVSVVGVCGSDVHYYVEGGIGLDRLKDPFVPGHEFAARICDEAAAEYGYAQGQLVAVDPARPCGKCVRCHGGHPNLCMNMVFRGGTPNSGALTEYVSAPPSAIFPVAEGTTPVEVAMMEPLGIAVHAVGLAKIRLMENIAVLGCGPIGLCLIQLARASGADNIFAVDPLPHRREAALKMGADKAGPSYESVAEWTDGYGVDLVLEATNDGNAYEQSGEIIRLGGRVILAGIPDGGHYGLESFQLRRKGATVKRVRRMGHVYPTCINLVARGLVDLEAIGTHRFSLEETNAAFELQAERTDGVLKAMVWPNGFEG
ncbi:MAG: alcohol dehydrogenase catalytic domain-containing protein [Rhodospirillales bacterium]|jgi:L-iditol 2-dehydrogenase|nr:alcohol dehydrogenase catalytic domain-containing protein [Rhodospirillales bacterium]